MTRAASLLVLSLLGGCLVPVREDGRMGGREHGATFALTLPVLLPPLVVIRPGVSVFQDLDEEVFYSEGYYWARRDAQWYHAREPHGAWTPVDRSRVSPALARSPPGHYRHWQGAERGRTDREEGRGYGLAERRD